MVYNTNIGGDNMIDEAIIFATKAHSGKNRKGSSLPYILHPLEAGSIAASMTSDEEVITAAILHDTIEDTDTTEKDLKEKFGDRVAYIVANESEDKMKDLPKEDSWVLRKQATIDHLNNCKDIDIKIVAMSDKLSNMRATHRDYIKYGKDFWNRFNVKDTKLQKWYYESFLETCKELKDYDAYKEYKWLLEETFK